jgi:phospholipid-binding lipoprotein MlaA
VKAKRILGAAVACAVILGAIPAMAQHAARINSGAIGGGPPHPQGQSTQVYSDPWAPFNEKMFAFNVKVDHYVLHPVAQGYADITPVELRESVGRFFHNVNFIPRMINNFAQLHFAAGAGELARFGINTTIGICGVFDPADRWFGIKEHDNDMGLTLARYGVPAGNYLVLPVLGVGTLRDWIGYGADGAMWPLPYFVPWYISLPADMGQRVITVVNYRSLHLDQFEEVDRYAIDLYGAVQDGYMQHRAGELEKVNAY